MGRYVFYVDLEKLPYKSIVLGDKTIVCLLKEDLDALPIVASPIQNPKHIVYCKDCVHRDPEDKRCDGAFCGRGGFLPVDDFDFCSCGRKKENVNGKNEVPQQKD